MGTHIKDPNSLRVHIVDKDRTAMYDLVRLLHPHGGGVRYQPVITDCVIQCFIDPDQLPGWYTSPPDGTLPPSVLVSFEHDGDSRFVDEMLTTKWGDKDITVRVIRLTLDQGFVRVVELLREICGASEEVNLPLR